ncbi:MAG: hypothetical protein GYB41_07105 [Oceanospirillales bacterium]|uniref:Uncharacterized protein UPF0259 n=1 Tax=Marinobacterium halophilum TaxID=267374 RepID=A0A2P8EM27_9GAMM|nr:YciC family protein [Marinobacterium halophilum]MBR9828395.1 hypothetical protein [Oceanospirillales bacterium]PSL10516.1 uncharacterized protein UPF0259 [Marinobacterium halophilum]
MTFDYLRQSLFFFRSHFNRLALIQLPFLAILGLVQFQLLQGITDAGEQMELVQRNMFLNSALDIAMMPIYWGATLLYMQSVLQGQPLQAGRALSLSLACWGRLLITYIISVLAISFGLVLLVIPGIYIGVRLAFAEFYCVMEGKGPMESIRASWEHTADFFWPLLQGMVLIFGVLLVAEMLFGQLLVEQQGAMMLVSLLIQFLGVLPTIYAYRLYCVMKEEQKSL